MDDEHYTHWLLFVEAVTLATDYSITSEGINRVRVLLNQFVVDYERLYYRYKEARLSACLSTIHALIHVHECLEWLGWFPLLCLCVEKAFQGVPRRSERMFVVSFKLFAVNIP